ncbi:hypothetical protein MTO96_026365 [Rhipicephalus appendiculatus]
MMPGKPTTMESRGATDGDIAHQKNPICVRGNDGAAVSRSISRKAPKLPVASANPLDVDPETLATLQNDDPSLSGRFADVGNTRTTPSTTATFVLLNDLFFRR